ncbi:MAG: hypothetical protein J7L61_01325, partial [Thermoplasmata archaeon]|nr:hypothetical protein [Thermoplasmata archaeon]
MVRQCPACGVLNYDDTAETCINCGSPLPPPEEEEMEEAGAEEYGWEEEEEEVGEETPEEGIGGEAVEEEGIDSLEDIEKELMG